MLLAAYSYFTMDISNFPELHAFNQLICTPLTLNITNLQPEQESQEYGGIRFELNGSNIIFRKAKITPTKTGQFVTLWKRKKDGPIEPFNEQDNFNFVIIITRFENKLGLFIFPKTLLAQKGVISTTKKDGKRALRVYPPWDRPTSKQAVNTQKWQAEYFINIDKTINKDQTQQFNHLLHTNHKLA